MSNAPEETPVEKALRVLADRPMELFLTEGATAGKVNCWSEDPRVTTSSPPEGIGESARAKMRAVTGCDLPDETVRTLTEKAATLSNGRTIRIRTTLVPPAVPENPEPTLPSPGP